MRNAKIFAVLFLIFLIDFFTMVGCVQPTKVSVAGSYKNTYYQYGPGRPVMLPHLKLELKADGTCVFQDYGYVDPLEVEKAYRTHIVPFNIQSFKTTYSIKDDQVILNVKPTEDRMRVFKIKGKNLEGFLGLWVRLPPVKK